MYIGLTCHNPIDWDMKTGVRETTDTWCLDTENGERWIGGRRSEICHTWWEKFGDEHRLSDGDTVSLTLEMDRSVSITLNKQKITNVFIDLPQKALWVVIQMWVNEISLIQSGRYKKLIDVT